MDPYTENVMKHFKNPKNFGEIKDADLIGEAGNIKCGDSMKIFIKLDGNKIQKITFQTLGCAAAISTSDVLCDMARGKTLEEAGKISNSDIVRELCGLPNEKIHCSVLAAAALKDAIRKYNENKK